MELKSIHFGSLFLIITLSLLSILPNVSSIKCWVCHSDSDPKCADPFDNTTLPIKDCREVKRSHLLADESPYETLSRQEKNLPPPLKTATMCRKIRQKIHGNWRTIRDCAFLGSPGEGTGNEHNCLYRRGTYDIYLEYCTCNSKDGCNHSWQNKPNHQIIITIFTITTLIATKISYLILS